MVSHRESPVMTKADLRIPVVPTYSMVVARIIHRRGDRSGGGGASMKQNFFGPLASAKRFAMMAALLAPIMFGFAQPATAASCTAVNGSQTLPGIGLGTIPSGGCTIGSFHDPATSNTSVAFLTASTDPSKVVNPSIYWFTWGGGSLTIQVETGNNGFGYEINSELGLKSANTTLNADKSLPSALASNFVPWDNSSPTGGPNGPVNLILNYNLAAGDYILDTYLGNCDPNHGPCTQGNFDADDPTYMVNFAPGAGVGTQGSETPLPAAFPLFATGFGAMGLLGWRRKRKHAAIAA